MNKIIILMLVLVAVFQSKAQDTIEGIWLTEEGNSKIEIYQKGEAYFGKIVWLDQPKDRKGNPAIDKNNPDKNLRNRQLKGIDLLQNVKYRDGKWYGQLYAPKRGLTMDAVITCKEHDILELSVSYQGFTRKQVWKRTNL